LNSSYKNIGVTLRVFVPEKEPCEIWTLTVKNSGDTPRKISSFAFVEWLLKGYPEYCDYYSSLFSEYDGAANILICYNKSAERNHDFYNGFIASDVPVSGFDSSKKAFVGYGQIDRPAALLEGQCRNSLGACEKLTGVLQHNYSLAPGESRTINIFIGAADTIDSARAIRIKYTVAGSVQAEYERVTQKIRNEYGRIHFDIPEIPAKYIFNHWIKRAVQLHTEVGTNTGKGLRDVLQGAWALSGYDGPGSKQKIAECLKYQFKDGHTLRGWNPVDDHHYSDGPVWIAPAINTYLKETRDFAFLDEVIPYFDSGRGTVFEHIIQSIRNSAGDLGPHGLIRAHYGDWNDSLNMMGTAGKGESVWTSIGMVFAIHHALEIAEHTAKSGAVIRELEKHEAYLKKTINEKGWDGEWYLEGYNDSGAPVGSHLEKEGYIYLNPQTWAILSGVVTPDRLPKILNVIDNDLECDYGSLVLKPAYKSPNPGIGRLTWFVPGMWENGSPYCHAGAFKIVADTILKRGREAYNTMMKILPDHELNPSEHSGVPPYMVTNMYFGPEHPRRGQILNTWITGTADWMFKAISAHIIGVSATYTGLKIDPCVPPHWKTFGMKRLYHGAEYDIRFFNPDGKMGGTLQRIEADGKAIEGDILPVFESGRHEINVYM
ncbi:MAG: hypothetical protein FWF29_01445, partial [Treponema sp.]|nr:hypothetical protein [Treponema sp.]